MGMTISLGVFNLDKLIEDIEKIEEQAGNPDRTAEFFIDNILPEFGIISYTARTEPVFITLWNEYYEDYNPAAQMMRAIDLYFGVYDTYIESSSPIDGVNAYEVIEGLGIEPIVIEE